MAVVYPLVGNAGSLDQAGLATDLRGNLVVRKTGGGEDGDFLATGDGVHGIDGRDACGDHLLWVYLPIVSTFRASRATEPTLEYGLMGLPLMSR